MSASAALTFCDHKKLPLPCANKVIAVSGNPDDPPVPGYVDTRTGLQDAPAVRRL